MLRPYAARLYNGLFRPTRHRILGMELSGVVASAGADVTRFAVGDAAIADSAIAFGAHAEVAGIPESGAIERKPDCLSIEEAAAVCFGGLGALGYINEDNVRSGDRVLINGASGATGTYAVQLAVALGAEVTGVCSSRNLDLVRDLGAVHVIDYTKTDFAQTGATFDMIFDAVGKTSAAKARPALAPTGTFMTIMKGGASPKERAAGLPYLNDRVYPLEQIVEAHRPPESGHKVGSVVVAVS